MRERSLDFICLGAPKAGTTSLHEALKDHRDLCLPHGKEIPLFLGVRSASEVREIWRTEMAKYYRCRNRARVYGMIVPKYWNDVRLWGVLNEVFPEIKVIVMLRDPVRRLVSEYRMYDRLGFTQKSFEEFVREGMELAGREDTREDVGKVYRNLSLHAILASRYRWKLQKLEETFPRENTHIMIFEEVVKAPGEAMRRLLEFLSVDPRPIRFPRKHTGSVSSFRGRAVEMLYRLFVFAVKVVPAKPFWKRMLATYKYSIDFWFLQNRAVRLVQEPIPEEVLSRLYAFFQEDIAAVETWMGRKVPWTRT